MRKELVDEIISLVEEYINELEDETVEKVKTARSRNYIKANNRFINTEKGTKEHEEADRESAIAGKKLDRNRRLYAQRVRRKEEEKRGIEKLRDYLLNNPMKAKEMTKAGDDQVNAIITQWRRNKLEKSVKKD